MIDVVPELENSFGEMERFTKVSGLNYPEAVLKYYKQLGEQRGFSVRENFSVLKHTLNLGRIDLLWVEPNIIFTAEFGSIENLLGKLFKVIEFSPDTAVIAMSSLSSCKPKDVKSLLEKSPLLRGRSKDLFVILDTAEKRVTRL